MLTCLYGTKGSITVQVLNKGEMVVILENDWRAESHPTAQNVHQPLIEDFVESVLINREPKVNGETGRMVAEIEEKIYENNN